MKVGKTIILLLALFFILKCTKKEDFTPTVECDFTTLISAEMFKNESSSSLTIDSIEINDDCLKIIFSASGCSGDSWEFKLIDAQEIIEPVPSERKLRFTLFDRESCDAWITKEVSFDISNLQLPNSNEIALRLINNDERIIYNY